MLIYCEDGGRGEGQRRLLLLGVRLPVLYGEKLLGLGRLAVGATALGDLWQKFGHYVVRQVLHHHLQGEILATGQLEVVAQAGRSDFPLQGQPRQARR